MNRTNKCKSISFQQATAEGQIEIVRSTTQVESKILDAVSLSSSAIQGDIQMLASKLDDMSIESFDETKTHFLITHQAALSNLTSEVERILTQQYDLQSLADQRRALVAQQKILDSLNFPLINDRRDHVHSAHKDTCQWIFSKRHNRLCQPWDDFPSWLASTNETPRIYWVHGKPGSGKSTLMRYLDENLSLHAQMLPWVGNGSILRAQYFFWNSGNALQKSLAGLLRSLCLQILEQLPKVIPEVVQTKRWMTALLSGNDTSTMEWTETELSGVLRSSIVMASKSAKIFLLVDGLDEIDERGGDLERLIDLLVSLTDRPTVKICVSSRPWNIFRDSFGDCPQLRLEEFTQNDISQYVHERLHSHQRFKFIVRRQPEGANKLINDVSRKSAGVFLWVRLVVEELRAGLRDGDDILRLSRKLEIIPTDLNEYFQRMMNSISPSHRREASMILQVALHEETEFGTLHPLYLMDISFLDEAKPEFAIEKDYDFSRLDLADSEEVQYRLDSTARRLNSRCMGLLECQYDAYSAIFDMWDHSHQETSQFHLGSLAMNKKAQLDLLETSDHKSAFGGNNVYRAFNFYVDFLHRSCRDFLLSSESQALLQQYTGGQFDVRSFLRSSRLTQMMALSTKGSQGKFAATLASYLLSTISLQEFRALRSSTIVATIMKPHIEDIAKHNEFEPLGWYINSSLHTWYKEQSSFLTLAIDFNLTSFIMANLTTSAIKKKKGRPILDYVLRPRFVGHPDLGIGNRFPDLEILQSVLNHGADPNQKHEDSSVWALFLFSLIGSSNLITSDNDVGCEQLKGAYFGALRMLISFDAASHLPKMWILKYLGDQGSVIYNTQNDMVSRQKILEDLILDVERSKVEDYPVSDILEHLCHVFGDEVDVLKTELENMMLN